MMTQMAPMLEMMKAKMGKRRFGMMMQTMGPMMSQMMEGGGGFGGGLGGGGGFPGGSAAGYGPTVTRRHRWRQHLGVLGMAAAAVDEHDPATDAHRQCRRRARPPPSSRRRR